MATAAGAAAASHPGLDGPGRAGAEPARQAARAGAARAKRNKVYTWFAHWCAGGRKVCSKFTCQYANEERKFTLMQKKFTSEDTKQPKKFTLMQKKFTKKVYIFDEKVYIIYQKNAKKFI